MSFQQLTLIGNVGQDPEMRYAPSGSAVTGFSVAVSWKRQGEEETTWFRCSAWDKNAETVNQYVHKGDEIMVQGRVSVRTYQRNDGTTAASLDVRVDRVQLLRNGRRGGEGDGQQGGPAAPGDLPF